MIAVRSENTPKSWPQFFRVGFGAVASIIFGLAIGLLCLTLVSTHLLGYKIATIQSYSMRPTLDRGDLIFVQPISIDSVEKGDVILFSEGRDKKILIAHRVTSVIPVKANIVESKSGRKSVVESVVLRTKGDANDSEDASSVDSTNFKGRVLFTLPSIGLVLGRIPVQNVLVLLALATGIAWIAYEWHQRRTPKVSKPQSAS
ncbi:MAG: signal peptidase I [Dehalococcoidia bacterium]